MDRFEMYYTFMVQWNLYNEMDAFHKCEDTTKRTTTYFQGTDDGGDKKNKKNKKKLCSLKQLDHLTQKSFWAQISTLII